MSDQTGHSGGAFADIVELSASMREALEVLQVFAKTVFNETLDDQQAAVFALSYTVMMTSHVTGFNPARCLVNAIALAAVDQGMVDDIFSRRSGTLED